MKPAAGRALRVGAAVALGVVALIVLAGMWVLGTETGARFAIERLTPDGFEVAQVEGRLRSPLVLHDVAYSADAARITIDRLRLEWEMESLLGLSGTRTFRVRLLEARGIGVHRKPAGPEEEPAPAGAGRDSLPAFDLPVRIEVRRAALYDLAVWPPGADSAAIPDAGLRRAPGADAATIPATRAAAPPTGTRAPSPARAGSATAAAPGIAAAPDTVAVIRVDSVVFSGAGEGSRFELASLRVGAPAYEAHASGHVRARGGYPLGLAFAWTAHLPGAAPGNELRAAGSGRAEGSLAELELTHRLTAPVDARLRARATDVLSAGRTWRAQLSVPPFPLDALREDLPPYRIRAELIARGEAPAGGATRGDAGPGETIAVERLVIGLPGSGGQLAVEGTVSLAGDAPVFDLDGRWSDLAWPPGSARFASPTGEFSVEGTADSYHLAASAVVGGTAVPEGRWRIGGEGTPGSLTLDDVRGRTLGGRVTGRGAFSWDSVPSWEVALAGTSLNPAPIAPEYPGDLDVEVRSRGEVRAAGPFATARVSRLEGRLRGEPISGRASLALAGDALRIDTVAVEYGGANLSASGSVGRRWDLSFRAEAPRLESLVADAAGHVRGEGTLSGPRDAPRIELLVRGGDIAVGESRVGALRAAADVDVSGERVSRLEMVAEGIESGTRAIDTLRLAARGRPQEHRITLAVRATARLASAVGAPEADARAAAGARHRTGDDPPPPEPLALDMALAGGFPGGLRQGAAVWSGRVAVLDLRAPQTRWTLREPAALLVSADSARLRRLCWTGATRAGPGAAGRVCLAGHWTRGGGGEGEIEAQRLPLALLGTFLPDDVDLEGPTRIVAHARSDAAGRLTAQARLHAGPGAIRYRLAPEDVRTRRIDSVSVQLDMDGRELVAAFDIALGGGDGFHGRVQSPLDRPPAERPLTGQIVGVLHDRGLTGALSASVTGTAGTLRVDLDVGGTAAEPRVAGRLALEEARALLVPLGIRVEDVTLQATGDGSPRWTIEGRAASGEGVLAVNGALRLASAESAPSKRADSVAARRADAAAVTRADSVAARRADAAAATRTDSAAVTAELTVRGKNFEAMDTELGRIVASPDLEVRFAGDRLEVTGEVTIPEARLTPEESQGTVSISDDVVIVAGAREEEEEVGGPLAVHAEVQVTLGGDVYIDGFGLTGRLDGALTVLTEPDRPIIARGELRIEEGEYTAYRQTLTIDEGRLIFADVPITNPGLDLRVVRRPDDVVVGLEVGGTAREPVATLFSEPALPEAEALSYLILGRPLSGASRSDGELLQNAARSAGLAGGQLIAARLGSALGLEEARIEKGDGGRQASLVLGTYVTPDLYLGYTIGIFEAGNILRLRYELSDDWALQTESGFETGADIFYTLEP